MSRKLSKQQEIQVMAGLLKSEMPVWTYADCATFVKELHEMGFKIVGRSSSDKPLPIEFIERGPSTLEQVGYGVKTMKWGVEVPDPEVTLANLREAATKAVKARDANKALFENEHRKNKELREANEKLRKELEKEKLDLINYSEWLDSEGLLEEPAEEDERTHTDLVEEFWMDRVPEPKLSRPVN